MDNIFDSNMYFRELQYPTLVMPATFGSSSSEAKHFVLFNERMAGSDMSAKSLMLVRHPFLPLRTVVIGRGQSLLPSSTDMSFNVE
jgi:hypothetical protein